MPNNFNSNNNNNVELEMQKTSVTYLRKGFGVGDSKIRPDIMQDFNSDLCFMGPKIDPFF